MSETLIETYESDRYRLEIHCDYSSDYSPMDDDNLSTIVCSHGRYALGNYDKVDFKAYDSWYDYYRALIKSLGGKKEIIYESPLFMYDHGGVVLSLSPFSCRWDSGKVGFVFVTRKSIKAMKGVTRITKKVKAEIAESVAAELYEYNNYLAGNVYGFELYVLATCKCCDHNASELEDSCWGFIADDDVKALEEMKGCLGLPVGEFDKLVKKGDE